MTREMAEAIGHRLGKYEDSTDSCQFMWGSSMRLRVALDISKPLKRFLRLRTVRGEGSIVSFTYERLPNFCYLCGLLGHIDRNSERRYEEGFVEPGGELQYGEWLRAPVYRSILRQGEGSANSWMGFARRLETGSIGSDGGHNRRRGINVFDPSPNKSAVEGQIRGVDNIVSPRIQRGGNQGFTELESNPNRVTKLTSGSGVGHDLSLNSHNSSQPHYPSPVILSPPTHITPISSNQNTNCSQAQVTDTSPNVMNILNSLHTHVTSTNPSQIQASDTSPTVMNILNSPHTHMMNPNPTPRTNQVGAPFQPSPNHPDPAISPSRIFLPITQQLQASSDSMETTDINLHFSPGKFQAPTKRKYPRRFSSNVTITASRKRKLPASWSSHQSKKHTTSELSAEVASQPRREP
ncbi:UNVERIFIED_CONTAM: hypothetical protein Slati_3936500 [Sesamum latifolium]|uniref:Zinc knuckle CX2CX4HX4C domain-containing protein n=1 Tax=Sesamum latifolium TaxID=2727402 RepID=A0AAW2TRP0_9LAMI